MRYKRNKLHGSDGTSGRKVPPVLRRVFLYDTNAGRIVALLAMCLVGMVTDPHMALAEQFEPPSLDGFVLHYESEDDGDGDGVNETMISQYMNQNGDSVFSMATNGRIWAWSKDTREDESGPRNYVIRDSDCDGVFDEVYGLDDEFHVPECVK
ncbi:MAG: hypothetical protein PVJ66_08520 [Gammaproteobacteria bacterium]|jgi:hypothetical protein